MSAWVESHWSVVAPAIGIGGLVVVGGILNVIIGALRDARQ